MSDRRYTAILGAAVLTAAAATFSVYRILRTAAEPRREPTRTVVLVARDLPAGVAVPREALAEVRWPARVAPGEAFESPDSVAGRVTRVALTRGEPVRTSALAPRGALPGLEGTIDPAHRAIAVRVHEAAGVSGLVRPNSRVDVLVTSRGDQAGVTARVVMSDVRVLGVGPARAEAPEEGDDNKPEPLPANVASIVTLEVTPAEAARVAAAEQEGTIQVVLRGFGAKTPAAGSSDDVPVVSAPVASTGATVDQLPGGPAVRLWGAMRPPAGASPMLVGSAPRPAQHATARRTVAARPAPEPYAAAPAAPAVRAPDSVTVRVYRGGQMTTTRVEAAPAAPAPAVVRTAAIGG